jgi:hypothetical protein
LRTRNQAEAVAILYVRNESSRQPALNLQIARAYFRMKTGEQSQMAKRVTFWLHEP